MKKIVSLVLALFFSACALSGCFFNTSENDSDNTTVGGGANLQKVEPVGTPTWTVEYSEYFGYSVEINGIIKNGKDRAFSYVSVEFSVYDAQGNNLGTASDSMNNLDGGETWKFNASAIGWFKDEPTSFKLADITTW